MDHLPVLIRLEGALSRMVDLPFMVNCCQASRRNHGLNAWNNFLRPFLASQGGDVDGEYGPDIFECSSPIWTMDRFAEYEKLLFSDPEKAMMYAVNWIRDVREELETQRKLAREIAENPYIAK